MTRPHPYVLPIVVTHNGAQYIERAVQSLFEHFRPVDPFDLVIVDNASHDSTPALLRKLRTEFRRIRIISLKQNIGFGPAHNVVFSRFPAAFYLLLNQDAWLQTDSVSPALASLIQQPDVAVCGLPLAFPDGSPQTFAYPFSSGRKWLLQLTGIPSVAKLLTRVPGMPYLFKHIPLGREFVRRHTSAQQQLQLNRGTLCLAPLRDVDWVCGAAMLLRGDFVEAVGGFDPNIFLYGEDEDICISAHRRGQRVAAADVPPITHALGWNLNQSSRTVANLKYSSLTYFINKNIPSPTERAAMKLLLPFYVFGFRGALLRFRK